MLGPEDGEGLDAPPTLIPPDDEVDARGAVAPVLGAMPHAFGATAPALGATAPALGAGSGTVGARLVPLRTTRPWWAWPAGLAAALAVAVVPFGLVMLAYAPQVEPVARATATVAPAPAAPAPVPAPAAVVSASVHASVPGLVQDARPLRVAVLDPLPEPTPRPAPMPTSAPAASPSAGTVSVDGDARDVWLEAGGKRIGAQGPIPPGTYVVRASFGDGLVRRAGEVVVRPGAEIHVRCASFVFACTEIQKPQPPAGTPP